MDRLSKPEWRAANKTGLIAAPIFTILMIAYAGAIRGTAGVELWLSIAALAFVGYCLGGTLAAAIVGLIEYEKGRQPEIEEKWLRKIKAKARGK